ncbi:MAG: hypothetical protein Q8S02_16835 [Hydrogenophaga sp.]|nr:hypothetical protein [Hydrogenophaga sp.]
MQHALTLPVFCEGLPSQDCPTVVLACDSPHYRNRVLALQAPGVIDEALQSDATARRIMAKSLTPAPGAMCGVRLNLNIHKRTGICVHSIHAGNARGGHRCGRGFWSRTVLSYQECVVLKDAFFNVQQSGREAIAQGTSAKFPMASIDGELVRFVAPHSFSGVEISFNPKSTHLFVDPDGFAVQSAEEVTIFGHRAYARGIITYFTEATAPARAGTAPSRAQFVR